MAELERLGLLDRVPSRIHTQVPHGDRSGVPIEPLLTVQWYCNAAELAKPAIAAVESGRTRFVPQQWENTFFAWMRDIQPWCISRQLWWGHRIPAWYGPDGAVFVERTEAEAQAAADAHYGRAEALTQRRGCARHLVQLGTLAVLDAGLAGAARASLRATIRADVLVTGFDIIFFWVARMMMMGLHFMGDVPFRTVYIHGLVRDEKGHKMSKSKGNVIDPIELIDAYGTDALRFTIAALAGPGRDIKLGRKLVESQRSFVTKLWNAARFCEMNAIVPDASFTPAQATRPLTRWILAGAADAVAEATAALEAYRFDEYASAVYRFTWNLFCDWFLELAKPALAASEGEEAVEVRRTAAHVLGLILRLLHPVMPFVTEEVWDRFGYGASYSLIRSEWPDTFAVEGSAAARDEVGWVVRLIGEVRTVRSEMNVPPGQRSPVLLKDALPETLARGERWLEAIGRMARASEFRALDGEVPRGSAQTVLGEATVVLPLAGLIDLEAERARLGRERDKLLAEAEKTARKLDNPDFVARAREEVVTENRERLAAAREDVARVDAALARLT